MSKIEEKAKAYNEALEKAKIWQEHLYDVNDKDYADELNYIFPELQESEDERIRKGLIKALSSIGKRNWGGIDVFESISWLEKQGEPQDKGEISDGYHTFNELYFYRMLYNAALFNMLPKEWVHKSKKHYDGEDCFGGGWFIVMANLPTGQISNHYELKDWDLFQIPEKEVADKWDGHTPQEAADRLHKYLLEKQGEQKPAEWSEEDESKRNLCFKYLTAQKNYQSAVGIDYINGCLDWLDSIKERVLPQPKQEWSKKDEENSKNILYILNQLKGNAIYSEDKIAENCIDWLKSLKDRVLQQNITYYNPYKEVVESIAEMCKHYDKASHNGLKDFYDNVKVKCKDAKEYDSLYPQSHWKPSEEHYELEEFAKIVRGNLTGISKAVQKLFEAKYLQLTGNKMYGGFKD